MCLCRFISGGPSELGVQFSDSTSGFTRALIATLRLYI